MKLPFFFARIVAPERTVGNRLRRPLTYALKAVDIPLSFISVPATLIRELHAPSIFTKAPPSRPQRCKHGFYSLGISVLKSGAAALISHWATCICLMRFPSPKFSKSVL